MKQSLALLMIIVTLLLNAGNSMAQTKPIGIGDQCPDIEIKNIINYKTNTARISDFKGKLLILDFWATWCAPCLSMMPVAEKLQQQFGEKIQILPVTYQSTAEVKNFLQQRAKTNNLLPPSATADISLHAAFPHNVVPHYVWIGPDGRVVAITSYGELTETNIQRLLGNGTVKLTEKKDEEKIIDEKQPMFITANVLQQEGGAMIEPVPNDNLLYHSVLTGFLTGFYCESGVNNAKITSKNNSVGGLYRIAAGKYELKMLLNNSTIWEVKNAHALPYSDSACLLLKSPEEAQPWMKEHCFCYELKFPPELESTKYDIMLADLNNYFGAMLGIKGGLEKRKVKCLILSRMDNSNTYASKGIEQQGKYNAYTLEIYNQPMYALVNFLSMQMDALPTIIDETGYTGNVDLQLNCTLSDLAAVNRELTKYGLQLKEEEREKEMIVIKDKDQ
jgi:thiol-disulfide isomerase/thioredoxin